VSDSGSLSYSPIDYLFESTFQDTDNMRVPESRKGFQVYNFKTVSFWILELSLLLETVAHGIPDNINDITLLSVIILSFKLSL
jgi:hypothetical protein